jgi:hypothetical protein
MLNDYPLLWGSTLQTDGSGNGRLMKTCSRCNVEKTYCSFNKYKRYDDGLQAWCRECHKHTKRAERYGLSQSEYLEIYHSQQSMCAGCGIHESDCRIAHAIDHNHNTGEVRGLLCNSCNRGLGLLKDDPDLLEHLASYLRTEGVYKKI